MGNPAINSLAKIYDKKIAVVFYLRKRTDNFMPIIIRKNKTLYRFVWKCVRGMTLSQKGNVNLHKKQ